MSNQVVRQTGADTLEQVLMTGDLKALSPEQRVTYYNRVCESVGLNPLTRPFDYLTLNNRLILYARKDAADQLRNLRGVSIADVHTEITDDLIVVTVKARTTEGRTDTDLGVVNLSGLKGDNKANAIMKAITKAKRRVTLSICGLGWLDETEIETIPNARPGGVDLETGEVINQRATVREPMPRPEPELVQNGNGNGAHAEPETLPFQWIMTAGLVDNLKHAANMANLLKLTDLPEGEQRDRVALYRAWRDYGLDTKPAAAQAIAGNLPDVEPEEAA